MSVFDTDFFLIKRAIDSVLTQDYKNFELIIIDDGSLNNSQFRLLSFVTENEDKITYLRHKNCGQANSINRGVLISTGDYVTIIDGDDEYKSNHLSSCLEALGDSDLIASTTETVIDTISDLYVPDKYVLTKLVHIDDCILFATLFGKKEVFENTKFEKKYAADSFFFDKAKEFYTVKKVDLRTYIYYRNSKSSVCSKIKREILVNIN